MKYFNVAEVSSILKINTRTIYRNLKRKKDNPYAFKGTHPAMALNINVFSLNDLYSIFLFHAVMKYSDRFTQSARVVGEANQLKWNGAVNVYCTDDAGTTTFDLNAIPVRVHELVEEAGFPVDACAKEHGVVSNGFVVKGIVCDRESMWDISFSVHEASKIVKVPVYALLRNIRGKHNVYGVMGSGLSRMTRTELTLNDILSIYFYHFLMTRINVSPECSRLVSDAQAALWTGKVNMFNHRQACVETISLDTVLNETISCIQNAGYLIPSFMSQ